MLVLYVANLVSFASSLDKDYSFVLTFPEFVRDDIEADTKDREEDMLEAHVRLVRGASLEMEYRPRNPNDYSLFLETSMFFSHWIRKISSRLIFPWISFLFMTFIQLSRKFPYVSGFYHMLSAICFHCKRCARMA